MKYKITIVEDDELIRNMVKINLEKNQYLVQSFPDSESLIQQNPTDPVDLFILDIQLPGLSGLELLKVLRGSEVYSPVPILMLTVQSNVKDKINALNRGADDYLVKPFNMEELLARVNALIRRSHGKRTVPSDHILIINNHRINLSSRQCQSNLGEVTLSEKEVNLLKYFSSHLEQALRRADILEEVWGMDVSPTPRTVDNFILKFRKLFETNPENPKHFISVRNKGYRFINE